MIKAAPVLLDNIDPGRVSNLLFKFYKNITLIFYYFYIGTLIKKIYVNEQSKNNLVCFFKYDKDKKNITRKK